MLRMAESIGLADHPPLRAEADSFIVNTPVKKSHRRRCNHSDLSQFGKEEKAKKVRERSMSQRNRMAPEPTSARKGSVKDVYINPAKPYEDPQQFVKTQRLLIKNDMMRLQNASRNS